MVQIKQNVTVRLSATASTSQ